ncbi:MAG TPA: hypothetical protein VEZ48_11080, partial [Sphingomonadaceae bacterium]|nr:hypothetical protein [Sphingomonadaceae bacterium]
MHAITGLLAAASISASPALAQDAGVPRLDVDLPVAAMLRVQTADEALARDAAEYARQFGVAPEQAMLRLRAQEASVVDTDRLRALYRDRLAGISIEHSPDYRIVVLLTGDDVVPDQVLRSGGMSVPVLFRTGALATGDRVLAAIRTHQAAVRDRLASPPGMGLDPRTGELVIVLSEPAAAGEDLEQLDDELEALTGVSVRIRVVGSRSADMAVEGGARMEGIDPRDGRLYACTAGFVVTKGDRTGVVTAAHCPDALTYHDPAGRRVPLDFVGEWGVAYQDVQVHLSPEAQRPLFYADTARRDLRALTGARPRASTRAGDIVCRRGEATGYSCSQVELVDYA